MINTHNFSGLFFRENRTYCPKDGVYNVIKAMVANTPSYRTFLNGLNSISLLISTAT